MKRIQLRKDETVSFNLAKLRFGKCQSFCLFDNKNDDNEENKANRKGIIQQDISK